MLTKIIVELYHGTNSEYAKSILNKGFMIKNCDEKSPLTNSKNWLHPAAIYFSVNRPLIALRFAEKSSKKFGDNSLPALFKVELTHAFIDIKTLDLTTDQGINLLYNGYSEINEILDYQFEIEPASDDIYYQSVYKITSDLKNRDFSFLNRSRENKISNFDSVAIEWIAETNKFSAVLAVIQEGSSFHQHFRKKSFIHSTSRNFHGLRLRDHLELCLIDLSLINSIQIIDPLIVKHNLDPTFVVSVLSYDDPDIIDTSK